MEPIKYGNLPDVAKINMAAGHSLAAHMVVDENGLRAEHLTTVQEASWDETFGESVYFCNDVCANDCELGSVRLLMVEMPKQGAAFRRTMLTEPAPPAMRKLIASRGPEIDTGKSISFPDPLQAETTSLENLSFFTDRLSSFAVEWSGFHIGVERAFADQDRLEKMRNWTYSRYRIAVHNADKTLADLHAVNLFFIVTGLTPGEDKPLFQAFLDHLSDAVLLYDAEEMPEFQPEVEPDCGD